MTDFSRWDISERAELDAAALAADEWHAVDDTDGRAGRIYVRVAKGIDGRLIITGMLLGDGVVEVTANVLRAVKPAEILATMQWRASGSPPPPSAGDIGPSGLARYEGMTEAIEASARQEPVESARGRRGPSRRDLERFAEAYLRHQSYTHHAMTRAARDTGISRAAANRWAARCREIGILPERGTRDE